MTGGGEAGRGIAACSHILTTDSTSPLSPQPGRPGCDVAVSGPPPPPLPLPCLTAARPASLQRAVRDLI